MVKRLPAAELALYIDEHLMFCFSIFRVYRQNNWFHIFRVQWSYSGNKPQFYAHRTVSSHTKCRFTVTRIRKEWYFSSILHILLPFSIPIWIQYIKM